MRFGIPGTRARFCAGPGRVHFRRAERHDRLRGGQKPGRKVGGSLTGTVIASRGGPLRGRGTTAAFGYLVFGASSTGRDWATVPADRSSRPAGPARAALGLWRICRHSTRPVLKHGPRSLTCARVIGLYETQRRSESEGRLGLTQVGSVPSGAAHHRPVPSASSVGRSKSVHAGTRKMVNYA